MLTKRRRGLASKIASRCHFRASILGLKQIVVFAIRIFFIHNYRIFEYSFSALIGMDGISIILLYKMSL